MSFILTKTKLGTSAKTVIFDTDLKINDFCFVEKRGFVIATDEGVGLLNFKNEFIMPWVSNLKKVSSIYFQEKKKKFYAIEGYRDIKYFSLNNPRAFDFMGGVSKELFNKYLSKTVDDGCTVGCSANKKGVYYIHSGLNRCLYIERDKLKVLMGNGRQGFSIATDLKDCQLNNPKGVCCCDKKIYISDTGNSCIRTVENSKTKVEIGRPDSNSSIKEPSKIVIKRGLIVFIDDNIVKYVNIGNSDVGNLYKAEDNIVSIDIGDDRSLYVLSEVKDAI